MKPSKKTITIEVETTETNRQLKAHVLEKMQYRVSHLSSVSFCKVKHVKIDRDKPVWEWDFGKTI